MPQLISVQHEFHNGSSLLHLPQTDLDPFETYPVEQVPKPRGRRGSLQCTEPLAAMTVDFDPLKERRENKDVPEVIIEEQEDYANVIVSNAIVSNLNIISSENKSTTTGMPEVSIDTVIVHDNFKSRPKSERKCFPMTLKQKSLKVQPIEINIKDARKNKTILRGIPLPKVTVVQEQQQDEAEEEMKKLQDKEVRNKETT